MNQESAGTPPPRVSFDSALGGHLPFSLDVRRTQAVQDAESEFFAAVAQLDESIALERAEKSVIASARTDQAMARAALEAAITAGVSDDEEVVLSDRADAAGRRLNSVLRESAEAGLAVKIRAARERCSVARVNLDRALEVAMQTLELRVLWAMRADIAACARTAYERARAAGFTDECWSSPQRVLGGFIGSLISDSVVLPSPSLFNERLDHF